MTLYQQKKYKEKKSMEKKLNSWGIKYVDKYIREANNNATKGYLVFINRHDLKVNQRFETLEKAIAFRDEALRLCEAKRLQEVKVQLKFDEYPVNLIKALDFDLEEVIDHFEERLQKLIDKGILTDREEKVIFGIYKENKTLLETGKMFGVTRERVRQIQWKALRKLKYRRNYFEVGEYAYKEELAKKDYLSYLEEKRKEWDYESAKAYIEAYEQQLSEEQRKALERDLEDLDLSTRSYNCLRRANIRTIKELISKTEDELFKIRNMGRKSAKEIIDKLDSLGLKLTDTDYYYNKN